MLPEVGLILLIMAFLGSLAHMSLLFLRFVRTDLDQYLSYSNALSVIQCFLVSMSFFAVWWAFVTHDFSVSIVAQHAHTSLPLFYLVGAIWGGHEGSLLLWAGILSWYILIFALSTKQLAAEIKLIIQPLLSLILSGFLGMLLFTSNPFARLLPNPPIEGADLNPLLQDPAFIIHPPILYLGYVGLAIPFAFAVAECVLKPAYSSQDWSKWMRPWVLFSLAALTVGIILGSWWAYYELGWGGWWFWDPVENASLMPWLVGCALLHLLFITKSQPVYRSWRILSAMFVFVLSLLGTFVTRSGVLSTVHAFASDKSRGIYLLTFLTLITGFSLLVYLFRRPHPDEQPPSSGLSKQSGILLGVMILLVAAFSVLLGTLYPLIAECLWNQTVSVGAPYFNTIMIPLMSLAMGLMIVVPHLSFKRQSSARWRQVKRRHFILSSIGVLMIILLGIDTLSLGALIGCCLVWLLSYSTLATIPTILHQPKRWGFFVAHMGVGIVATGIILSSSLEREKIVDLKLGDRVSFGQYSMVLNQLNNIAGSNYEGIEANIFVKRNDKVILKLKPQKRYYATRDLVTTESDIGVYHLADFYIALGEPLGDDRWSIRCYIKPFVRLIWLGGLLIALGMLCGRVFKYPVLLKTRNPEALECKANG